MSALLRVVAPVSVVLVVAACDVRVSDKGVSMGVFSGRASDTWSRSYTLPAGARLDVANVNGPITVTAAPGTTAEIKVEREARSSSDEAAKAALADSPVHETSEPDAVRVEVRRLGGATGGRREGFGGGRGQLSSNVTVSLPPGLVASFVTENGAVRLEQVAGRISASSSNGPINGEGLTGSVSATTVNGGIRLGMRSISDPLELSVVNGGIELLLPPAVKARLKLSALNGSVFVSDDLKLVNDGDNEGGPARRRVEGTLNGGGPLVSAQATNGGVRISTAREQAAR